MNLEIEQRREYIKGQMMITQGRISYWHAQAVSGAYKQRRIFKGFSDVEFTEEEKLADALSIMNTHIERLSDLNDSLAKTYE